MNKVLSFIYSLFINIKAFGFKRGIKIPILINHHVKVKINPSANIILTQFKFGVVRIGFGGSINISPFWQSYFILENNSTLVFKGEAIFSEGVSIRLNPKAKLEIGNNFSANRNFQINVDNKVIINEDVLIGWNVSIQDGDGHKIKYINSDSHMKNKILYVGSNVWIASNAYLLGGSWIDDNSVIALDSLCNKKYPPNSLVGGIPAHVIKNIRGWER